MKKIGRNDPCPCGSGKKFKKCCESSMIGGRFKAVKVETLSALKIATASRLTGLFKSQVASVAVPSGEFKPIKAKPKTDSEAAVSEISLPTVEKTEISAEGVERKDDI